MPVLSTLGTLLGLAGTGTSVISNILKGQDEEKYEKNVEGYLKKEKARQEKVARQQALSRYIGQGSEELALTPSAMKSTPEPEKPDTTGYDIASGVGSVVSQVAPALGQTLDQGLASRQSGTEKQPFDWNSNIKRDYNRLKSLRESRSRF